MATSRKRMVNLRKTEECLMEAEEFDHFKTHRGRTLKKSSCPAAFFVFFT